MRSIGTSGIPARRRCDAHLITFRAALPAQGVAAARLTASAFGTPRLEPGQAAPLPEHDHGSSGGQPRHGPDVSSVVAGHERVEVEAHVADRPTSGVADHRPGRFTLGLEGPSWWGAIAHYPAFLAFVGYLKANPGIRLIASTAYGYYPKESLLTQFRNHGSVHHKTPPSGGLSSSCRTWQGRTRKRFIAPSLFRPRPDGRTFGNIGRDATVHPVVSSHHSPFGPPQGVAPPDRVTGRHRCRPFGARRGLCDGAQSRLLPRA